MSEPAARFDTVDLVEVRAWGTTVGALAPSARRGAYAFEYDPDWVHGGIELAPVLMPLGRRVFTFAGLAEETYQGLPPMIADALPDRFGNTLVDAWLARNGISPDRVTPLDRLAYLGSRGMGALEFAPRREPNLPPPTALALGDLVTSARRAVEGTLASENESQAALRRIIDVGTSAGGARAKAIINVDHDTDEIRSGHLPPAPGFEPWLIKFDGVGLDSQLGPGRSYGRIEYAYSLMVRAARIDMSPTRLLEEHGRAHFMTRRFDRTADGIRLHLQSLCATDGLDFNAIGVNDYAQYFARVEALDPERMVEAFRRMVFNVAAANHDDHTKNVGFLMTPQGEWSLAPAYDITHAYNPDSRWLSRHLMSVNGRFSEIGRGDLLEVGQRFGVHAAASVLSEVNAALDSWPQFAAEAGLDAAITDQVAADFRPIRR
ncbi:MAG: phosphatidylinositol kinase [Microbacteriaceae bacterium]|nr:phosphatidylinositol kinase [Microbacteriaceae bacterium]